MLFYAARLCGTKRFVRQRYSDDIARRRLSPTRSVRHSGLLFTAWMSRLDFAARAVGAICYLFQNLRTFGGLKRIR
jgi:hypothetical protein